MEKWITGYRPNTSLNFKGVKSTVKADDGTVIRSGQLVRVHGRINAVGIEEVYFEPNHGFKVQGNNLADAYVLEVVKDVSLFNVLKGVLGLIWFNLSK